MSEQREAFEQWYEADCLPAESDWFKRDDDGDYWHATTSAAWAAWQARAALSSAPPNLSAAVAAAIEQDARVCDQVEAENARSNDGGFAWQCAERIRAQQDPDGLAALRDLMLKVARKINDGGFGEFTELGITEVVDRVLRGEQK